MKVFLNLLRLRPVMRRVCAWCQRDLGVVACRWRNVGMVSHGICDECCARWLGEPAGATHPTLNEAAAAQAVSPLSGPAHPLQVNRNATPDPTKPAVMDNPSGGPAASFTPSDGIWSWLDRLIKRFTTKGGRNV